MTRRKGELTPSRIDRECPYQVALPADQVSATDMPSFTAFAESCLSVLADTRCAETTRLIAYSASLTRRMQTCFAKGSRANRSARRIAAVAVAGSCGRSVISGSHFAGHDSRRGRRWSMKPHATVPFACNSTLQPYDPIFLLH